MCGGRDKEISCLSNDKPRWYSMLDPLNHTCNDLGTLKILIGMKIAGGERKVDAHQQQEQVDAPPDHLESCLVGNVSSLLIVYDR